MFQFLVMIKHILFPALCPLDLKLILFQTFSDAFAFLASCQLRSSEHTMFMISAYVELDFFYFLIFIHAVEWKARTAGRWSVSTLLCKSSDNLYFLHANCTIWHFRENNISKLFGQICRKKPNEHWHARCFLPCDPPQLATDSCSYCCWWTLRFCQQ